MINYQFKINMQGERERYENLVFTTGDKNGYRLEFVFYSNGKRFDTSLCGLTVKAKRADGVLIIDSGITTGEGAYYDVADNAYGIKGELEFEVALVKADGSYATTQVISAQVREGFGENGLSSEDNEPVLAKLEGQYLECRSAENANSKLIAENTARITANAGNITVNTHRIANLETDVVMPAITAYDDIVYYEERVPVGNSITYSSVFKAKGLLFGGESETDIAICRMTDLIDTTIPTATETVVVTRGDNISIWERNLGLEERTDTNGNNYCIVIDSSEEFVLISETDLSSAINTNAKTIAANKANIESNTDNILTNARDIASSKKNINNLQTFVGIQDETSRNIFANAIKGTASGTAIRLEDISPVEHELRVKARKKNLFVITKDTESIKNGVTIKAVAGESKFTVTNTEQTGANSVDNYNIALPAGTYTFSISGTQSTKDYWYIKNKATGAFYTNAHYTKPTTITLTEETTLVMGLVIHAETTGVYNNTEIKAQIEKGSVASEWVPYVDVSTVKIMASDGENILPYPYVDTTNSSEAYVVEALGEENIKITRLSSSYENVFFTLFRGSINLNGTFCISGIPDYISIDVMVNDAEYISPFLTVGDNRFYEINGTLLELSLWVCLPEDVTEAYIHPRTEKVNAEYKVNTDGTVTDAASIYPNMTLLADTNGAVIDVEYNRDTNKAFQELANAIIALGGTI